VFRWGCLGFSALIFCWASVLSAEPNLQNIIKEGLQAEALKEYPQALEKYGQVLQMAPQNSLARSRIIAIFKSLSEQNQPTDHLTPLVAEDILDELRGLGYIKSLEDQQAILKKMTTVFWSVVAVVVLLIAGFLFYVFKRSRAEDEAKAFSTNKSLSEFKRTATNANRSVDHSLEAFSKRESVITDKTRKEITSVITGVKSLTGAQPRPANLDAEPPAEPIENSEVVAALAQTLVTDVSSEQTDQGKYSKMTIDASLIFDEGEGKE
jgi:hypothetical protein